MPYRERVDTTAGTGELVTLRTYLDPVEAQIARGRLGAEGIEAHVLDEGLHNVIMPGSVSGIRIWVREGNLVRAEEILREHPWESARDDGEGSGVVRCPRCELAYCFHERMNIEGNSAATALSFLAAIFMVASPKRWHCHKCGHVWDDPKEGPAEMTKLGPDNPRPVFRLRRAHAGMGLFLGVPGGVFAVFVAAFVAFAVLGRAPGFLALPVFLSGPILGWLIGRAWTYDLCSEPGCRAPLAPDREDCPRCAGEIAGVIHAADQHYAASADFRRELAALRAKERPTAEEEKEEGRGAALKPAPTRSTFERAHATLAPMKSSSLALISLAVASISSSLLFACGSSSIHSPGSGGSGGATSSTTTTSSSSSGSTTASSTSSTSSSCGEPSDDGGGADAGAATTTIAAARMGNVTTSITVAAVVTAVQGPSGDEVNYYIEDPAGGPYSGIVVYCDPLETSCPAGPRAGNPSVGDYVLITGAISTYKGQLQISPTDVRADRVRPRAAGAGRRAGQRRRRGQHVGAVPRGPGEARRDLDRDQPHAGARSTTPRVAPRRPTVGRCAPAARPRRTPASRRPTAPATSSTWSSTCSPATRSRARRSACRWPARSPSRKGETFPFMEGILDYDGYANAQFMAPRGPSDY